MLLLPPPLYRRRRGRIRPRRLSAPPAELVLISAQRTAEPELVLGFDRAIDIAGLVGSGILLDDAESGLLYEAQGPGGAVLLGPATVKLALNPIGSSSGPQTLLTAASGAGNGITAADDGGSWQGATALPLPYP